MKPRLIILSDLFGLQKSAWKKHYIDSLKPHFDIQYYDCCELGNIDKYDFTEKTLHEQYLNSGVSLAVEKILKLEKNKVNILAFSIGGVIAWKAALQGLKIDHLFAISSTRLRHETNKPKGDIHLYFGENDYFVPEPTWFERMEIDSELFPFKDHNMYRESDFARTICKKIISKI